MRSYRVGDKDEWLRSNWPKYRTVNEAVLMCFHHRFLYVYEDDDLVQVIEITLPPGSYEQTIAEIVAQVNKELR